MTTSDNRYAHSKIYKLTDGQYYYYGSTCLPLYKRAFSHRKSSKKDINRKVYTVFTYERFARGEIIIRLVEELKLENKEQLLRKENEYIEKHINDKFCLNSQCAVINLEKKAECKKIYYEDNKEKIAQHRKIYYEDNKEKLSEHAKLYREQNKEK